MELCEEEFRNKAGELDQQQRDDELNGVLDHADDAVNEQGGHASCRWEAQPCCNDQESDDDVRWPSPNCEVKAYGVLKPLDDRVGGVIPLIDAFKPTQGSILFGKFCMQKVLCPVDQGTVLV